MNKHYDILYKEFYKSIYHDELICLPDQILDYLCIRLCRISFSNNLDAFKKQLSNIGCEPNIFNNLLLFESLKQVDCQILSKIINSIYFIQTPLPYDLGAFIITSKFLMNGSIFTIFVPTSSMFNWCANITAIPYSFTKLPYMSPYMIHYGYGKIYSSAFQQLDKIIQSSIIDLKITHNIDNPHLISTGMSLGGALAGIHAFRLSQIYPNHKITNISFGSPKFASKEFIQHYKCIKNITTRLYVNNYDIVPTLPPKTNIIENLWYHLAELINGKDDCSISKFKSVNPFCHAHYLGVDFSEYSFMAQVIRTLSYIK